MASPSVVAAVIMLSIADVSVLEVLLQPAPLLLLLLQF
jgi:hypothetical protein